MNFYCTFCDQRCHKLTWDSEYWNCDTCKVRFNEVRPEYQIFTIKLDDKTYELTVAPALTIISQIISEVDQFNQYDIKYVFRSTLTLKGVTPQNAAYKIKTLLVFS